ncbi:hypothetical protein FQR65_LT16449 [Abscondita terminalis]|nr:hypothetical protein FQR65_LT16449 [Abscondita terminalis]
MEKIKIYAPVDCTVKKLSELNDGVFSTGMLGDGFYIEPKSQNYLSPIDKGKVSLITETKHAYFFEVNKKNVNILMHIGLESIKLNGTPFDTKVSVGELIGFFELSKESNDVVISDEIDLQSYFNQEDSYTTLARQINTTVGNKENYEKVYNCMTRLRFKILNKSLVEEEKLRFIKGVKGDVFKVKDKVVELNKDIVFNTQVKNGKTSLIKKLFGVIGGVMVPLIPVLIGADVPLKFLALLAAISTASYFGYSVFMAGAIGLIIANPILFDGGATTNGPFGIQFGLIDFGSDFKEPFAGFNGIPITGFTNKPFVLILSIYFAFRLDK